MEKCEANIDIPTMVARVMDENIRIPRINILLTISINTFSEESVLKCIGSIDSVNRDQILKLQKQFGHCSPAKMVTILESSNCEFDKTLLEQSLRNCELYLKFGKQKPRPVSGLPLCESFNDFVAMDLPELRSENKQMWYIHMIDLFTRFSQACIIPDKKQNHHFSLP